MSDGEELERRLSIFSDCRDNRGVLATNRDSEELKNISAPLGGLSELQAQAQEHQASIARLPFVKLTGISPSGLNATSLFEIQTFYDSLAAFQRKFLEPNLLKIIRFAQLNIWGTVNPAIVIDWVPLWEMSETETVAAQKTAAETHQLYIDSGVLHPTEVRKAVAADPDTPYAGLDIEDIPDLREELDARYDPAATSLAELAQKQQKDDETPRNLNGEPLDASEELNSHD